MQSRKYLELKQDDHRCYRDNTAPLRAMYFRSLNKGKLIGIFRRKHHPGIITNCDRASNPPHGLRLLATAVVEYNKLGTNGSKASLVR